MAFQVQVAMGTAGINMKAGQGSPDMPKVDRLKFKEQTPDPQYFESELVRLRERTMCLGGFVVD